MSNHLIVGATAESLAEQYLIAEGLIPLARNYRCQYGEIDLIMSHQHDLVFIEVRLRRHSGFVSAAESVDKRKQKKLINTAEYFLQEHPHHSNRHCRFDVLALSALDTEPIWIPNAFGIS